MNARFTGPNTETPLHWAASNDDIEVLYALLDAGVDIESPGAVIAGGMPLDDTVAFGQWQTTRRLVERGAQNKLWHAAALGLMDRIKKHLPAAHFPHPTKSLELSGRRATRTTANSGIPPRVGADLSWVGYDGLPPPSILHAAVMLTSLSSGFVVVAHGRPARRTEQKNGFVRPTVLRGTY